MERNFRFRISGVAFFVIIFIHLALTVEGKQFISDLIVKPDEFQIMVAVISGVFLIFASDAAGYIFSSIFLFFFNLQGGYAGIYKRHLGDLNDFFIDGYNESKLELPKASSHEKFSKRWGKYNTEHSLIYFLWHRHDGVSDNLNDWIERRHTAFFTSFSSITAAVIATAIAGLAARAYNLHFNSQNLITFAVTLVICIIIGFNGIYAMRDAVAITDLHVAGFVNPRVREIFRRYPPPSEPEPQRKENASSSPKPKKKKNAA